MLSKRADAEHRINLMTCCSLCELLGYTGQSLTKWRDKTFAQHLVWLGGDLEVKHLLSIGIEINNFNAYVCIQNVKALRV